MAFLTMKEAAELESVTSEAIRLKLTANRYPLTRLADNIAKNGKRPTLIHIDSLSINAQIKFYRAKDQETATPNGTLTTATEKGKETALLRLKAVKEAELIKEHHISRGLGKKGIVGPLTALATKHSTTYQTLNRWMRGFRSGGFASLLPRGAATPRKSRFDGAIKDIIQTEYLSQKKPSLTDVFRAVQIHCIENLLDPPSYKTVQRLVSEVPLTVSMRHRSGRSEWLSKLSPKGKRDLTTIAVNEWWVSDHREFDCFLYTGQKVKRPWLTSWEDMRTRKIVGWHISFAPNSRTIALSYRNGVLTHGRNRNAYMDNGKDFKSHYLSGKTFKHGKMRADTDTEGVFALLGCGVTYARPYEAWSKIIERWQRNICTWERTLPGWCGKDNKERPEKLLGEIKDGKLLTPDEFSNLFKVWVEQYNNTIHSELEGRTPNEMYEGVEKEIPSDRALDLLLMKHVRRRVHPQGILAFTKKYHYSLELGLHIGEYVTVRYDPANIGQIHVFLNNGRKYLCTATNKTLMTMGCSEEVFKENAKNRSDANKRIMQYPKDRHVINHGDTHLAALNAAKKGKGYLAATSEDIQPEGKILRFVSKLDAAAKQIEEAERQNPTPEFTPEPTADDILESDDYLEKMQRALAEKEARMEAENEREQAQMASIYQR